MTDPLRIIDLDRMQEEAFRRGFDAAKSAAKEIVESERHYASDCGADFSHMLASIEQLQPEVTR